VLQCCKNGLILRSALCIESSTFHCGLCYLVSRPFPDFGVLLPKFWCFGGLWHLPRADWMSRGRGRGSPGSDHMPLPLTSTPQNYSKGRYNAVCSLCTKAWCTLHPGVGGRSSTGFRIWCRMCLARASDLMSPSVPALLAPKGGERSSVFPSRGRIRVS
jgi:hypothetical protein